MDDGKEPILTDRHQTLEQMSVDEIEAYIGELRARIAECELELEKKRAQKSAADALFGDH